MEHDDSDVAAGMNELPLINCHVHIFTSEHVPAHLARTIVPWPIFKWLSIRWIVRLLKWLKQKRRLRFKEPWKSILLGWGRSQNVLRRWHVSTLLWVIGLWLALNAISYINEMLADPADKPSYTSFVLGWLRERHLLVPITSSWLKVCAIAAILMVVKPSRRLIWPVLVGFYGFMGKIPGKQVKELWDRYKLIVNFSLFGVNTKTGAKQSGQGEVLEKLVQQYPAGTRFVVLPMDMEFMEAGPVGRVGGFHQQMAELVKLKASVTYKDAIEPFIHVDPRRVAVENAAAANGNLPFFAWDEKKAANGGRIELLDCAVDRWLKDGCSGFKIYPALGYYPFDEQLLPIWAFAAQEGLPIMTHCIRGVIHYRGPKKKEWNAHPVFKRNGGPEALELLQLRNVEFQEIFTHPLNYLCLLEPALLEKVVEGCQDASIRALFRSKDYGNAPRTLKDLKLCFAHFGGDDEWRKHLEADTDVLMQQLGLHPDRGLDLPKVFADGSINWNNLESYWRNADWYTTICSLMLRYEHVYADISYILHDEIIQPLLKRTLAHPTLQQRVLFGTDFYVVRNHKSDKELLVDIQAGLSTSEFDRIARVNPVNFL